MKKILILGVDGNVGNMLYNKLKNNKNFYVYGTSRSKNSNHTFLDINDAKSIEKIEWNKYELIYFCIGSINYNNSAQSVILNIQTNTLGPIKVIKNLSKKHTFIYLSTNAIQKKGSENNSYTFSKSVFENLTKIFRYDCNVKIIRLPGLYFSNRKEGFMFNLKKAFENNLDFELNFNQKKWHIMELSRAVEILSIFAYKNIPEKIIDVGYPIVTSPIRIINFFEKWFNKKINIVKKKEITSKFIPNIKALRRHYKIKQSDFYTDLKRYLMGG